MNHKEILNKLEAEAARLHNKQLSIQTNYVLAVQANRIQAINEYLKEWEQLYVQIKSVNKRIQLLKEQSKQIKSKADNYRTGKALNAGHSRTESVYNTNKVTDKQIDQIIEAVTEESYITGIHDPAGNGEIEVEDYNALKKYIKKIINGV